LQRLVAAGHDTLIPIVTEISHAIDRYEREREGLGAEFWNELKAAMRKSNATASWNASRSSRSRRSTPVRASYTSWHRPSEGTGGTEQAAR
jgi:hypothetical protein